MSPVLVPGFRPDDIGDTRLKTLGMPGITYEMGGKQGKYQGTRLSQRLRY